MSGESRSSAAVAEPRRSSGPARTAPSGQRRDDRRAPSAAPRTSGRAASGRAGSAAVVEPPRTSSRAASAAVLEPPRSFGEYRTAGEGMPARRTVTIRGQVSERYAPRSARRRPERRHERSGFRPDRTAMWAVLLCVLMILVAVTSAHGATVHGLAHVP